MENNKVDVEGNEEPEQGMEWWRLPFDTTANFSLLGYLMGGSYWDGNRDKTVTLTLDE